MQSEVESVRVLEGLLQAFWLRPETALWRTFDCMAMRDVVLASPSLDLGCGDGLLSYLMAGGRLLPSCDAYTDTTDLAAHPGGGDIYNVVPVPDVERVDPGFPPRYRFDVGVDHKAGLLAKAAQLKGFYGSLVQGDLDSGVPLPDAHFASVFSNMIYWLDDVDQALREIARVMRDDGTFCCFVPNASFHEMAWLYFARERQEGYDYLAALDRGYHALVKHAYAKDDWVSRFDEAGFRVVRHEPLLYKPVMDIWNIGTRPISHLLVSMANGLEARARNAEKAKWVSFFSELFAPLLSYDWSQYRDSDHAFHFFLLQKRLPAV